MDGFNDSEPRALTWAASSSLHKPDIYAGDAKHDEGADPPGSFPGQSIYSISVKGTINNPPTTLLDSGVIKRFNEAREESRLLVEFVNEGAT
ncbi:hypothetical protein Q7P35_000253 [Cladosporium inversicolor]